LVVTTTTVTCGECGRVLDEDPALTTKPPCPHCGSTRRNIQKQLAGSVQVFATLAMVRIRESVERNWFWIGVLVALAVGGVLAKWLLPLWVALVVALALVALGVLVRPRASARVIERDHFPARED
jgi:DNA-directed RNA polymerase subunit RPC12/RpoP